MNKNMNEIDISAANIEEKVMRIMKLFSAESVPGRNDDDDDDDDDDVRDLVQCRP